MTTAVTVVPSLTATCPDCGVRERFDGFDDFAGPGGWDEGARSIGLRLLGYEWDAAACATANASGHARIQADVTAAQHDGRVPLYVGSPPCTLFSAAGSGVGRSVLDVLADGIQRILRGQDPTQVRTQVRAAIHPVTLADLAAKDARRPDGKRWPAERIAAKARQDAATAALVLEPARRIIQNTPDLIALEQVPAVLPLWQVYTHELRRLGYSAWTGILCAADYGVPQTRYRAILMASRVSVATPPEPTHAEHPEPDGLFGVSRLPWVSMAQALGWDDRSTISHPCGRGMAERHGDRPGPPLMAAHILAALTGRTPPAARDLIGAVAGSLGGVG